MKRTIPYLLIALNALMVILAIFHDRLQMPWLLQAMGRTHPMLLHLPIGFLLAVTLLYLARKSVGHENIHPILTMGWNLTALTAVLSALAGLALSTEEGYIGEGIDNHLTSGVVLSLLTGGLALIHALKNNKPKIFQGALAITVIMLFVTGHTGSSVTHGEEFLTAPFKSQEQPLASDSMTFFEASVLPVLEKKCNTCHNPSKHKGDLVMTTAELLLKGGEHGPVWIPGKADSSAIVWVSSLPEEDDHHMPPKGKPQLTEHEKQLIRMFVARGADMALKNKSVQSNDSLRLLADIILPPAKSGEAGQTLRDLPTADESTISSLNIPARNVSRLSLVNEALQAAFFLPGQFRTNMVEELEPVGSNIVELNLSGMPLDEATLRTIADFENLEVLNLNQSPVTDDWLNHLSKLRHLRKVSVAGTAITSKGLDQLAAVSSIREVFIWGTPAASSDLSGLRKKFPDIQWNAGTVLSAKEILRLTPPILTNENRILTPGETIKLRHNLPGVQIRYSLNPSVTPDSVTGDIYQGPLKASGTVQLEARAVKNGWRSSKTASFTFFTAGMKPDSIVLNSAPNKDYRSTGASALIDARGGDLDNFRDGLWLGYRENSFSATAEFSRPTALKSIAISYLKNIGSYIMPPASIQLFAGNDRNNLKLQSTLRPKQPGEYLPNAVEAVPVNVNGSYQFWKVVVNPVTSLPSWHGGKGQKGWVMIDELFFYPADIQ